MIFKSAILLILYIFITSCSQNTTTSNGGDGNAIGDNSIAIGGASGNSTQIVNIGKRMTPLIVSNLNEIEVGDSASSLIDKFGEPKKKYEVNIVPNSTDQYAFWQNGDVALQVISSDNEIIAMIVEGKGYSYPRADWSIGKSGVFSSYAEEAIDGVNEIVAPRQNLPPMLLQSYGGAKRHQYNQLYFMGVIPDNIYDYDAKKLSDAQYSKIIISKAAIFTTFTNERINKKWYALLNDIMSEWAYRY